MDRTLVDATYTPTVGAPSYPVHWIEGRFPRKRKPLWLGICGKTREPFTIAVSQFQILMVGNLYADDHACEEGQRCLNTACPLNHTTRDTMARAMGYTRPPRWMAADGIRPIPVDADFRAAIDRVCNEHPEHGTLTSGGRA